MTPKEKALEIWDRFLDLDISHYDAIASALICVDEILQVDMFDMSEELFNEHIDYWLKVKQEIIKL